MYFWVVSLAIPNNITLSMFLLLVLKIFVEIILKRVVIIYLVNVFVTCSEIKYFQLERGYHLELARMGWIKCCMMDIFSH